MFHFGKTGHVKKDCKAVGGGAATNTRFQWCSSSLASMTVLPTTSSGCSNLGVVQYDLTTLALHDLSHRRDKTRTARQLLANRTRAARTGEAKRSTCLHIGRDCSGTRSNKHVNSLDEPIPRSASAQTLQVTRMVELVRFVKQNSK